MGKGRNAKSLPKSRSHDKKNDKSSSIDISSLGIDKYKIFVLILAAIIGYLHSQHVYGMFEQQRFFSHLSTLERELSFRTEMGLYYSYYKTMAEAPSLYDGLHDLVRCNITEYPDKVNVLRRFNLYPEVFLGMAYRAYNYVSSVMNWETKKCYSINRGQGLSPVESCVGLGDIAHFYVFPIFGLAGFQMAVIFILGCYVGGNILGGVLSVSSFFFNHGEATRVMWTPPLRESFSFPFLMVQMLTVVHILKVHKPSVFHSILLAITTVLFMLPWQFAQFALLTQVCSLFALYILKFIDSKRMLVFLNGLLIGHAVNFVAQFANTLLLSSFFMAAMIAILIVVKLESTIEKLPNRVLIWLVQGISFIVLSVAIKIAIAIVFQIKDDAHIFDILKSKFTDYKDFHTQLYVCAPEFDFIGWEYFEKLSKTFLIPSAGFVTLTVVIRVLINEWKYWIVGENIQEDDDDQTSPTKPFARALYLVLQAACFLVMAVMLMRLKLFSTPALCILSSLLASREVYSFIPKRIQQYAAVFIILGVMSVQGYPNLKEQFNMKGEYNNPELEQLIEWLREHSNPNDVFAGAMPTMAAIKLSVKRPIVNHPHYEDSGLRARTKRVYQMYSRKPCEFVHDEIKAMGVTYYVFEDSWCFRSFRDGCALPEVWDIEDPKNKGRPSCCSLIRQNPGRFKIIFSNKTYVVLKV
uniref:Uncharacterized protein n=2 Tax=Clytia hemisphaerica TaxID=252671 RepID=A0A7M5WVY2_9CNID